MDTDVNERIVPLVLADELEHNYMKIDEAKADAPEETEAEASSEEESSDDYYPLFDDFFY